MFLANLPSTKPPSAMGTARKKEVLTESSKKKDPSRSGARRSTSGKKCPGKEGRAKRSSAPRRQGTEAGSVTKE